MKVSLNASQTFNGDRPQTVRYYCNSYCHVSAMCTMCIIITTHRTTPNLFEHTEPFPSTPNSAQAQIKPFVVASTCFYFRYIRLTAMPRISCARIYAMCEQTEQKTETNATHATPRTSTFSNVPLVWRQARSAFYTHHWRIHQENVLKTFARSFRSIGNPPIRILCATTFPPLGAPYER